MDQATLPEIAKLCHQHDRVVVVSHARPDGDAIGSSMAMALALREVGKEVVVLNEDVCPASLEFLPEVSWLKRSELEVPHLMQKWAGEEVLLLVLDASNRARLGGHSEVLLDVQRWCSVNLDHHVSNDGFADFNYVDAEAPATGEIVHELLGVAGWSIPATARDHLFAAISTDTGSLRYPNTTAKTFRVMGDLVEAGADVGALNQALYESYPMRRLHLLRELMGNMEFVSEGKLASWTLSLAIKEKVGMEPGDSEGLIEMIRSVDTVVGAAFFDETEHGVVRVSMRSKDDRLDVSEVCGVFGGGGHRRASGARVEGKLEEVRERVVAEMEKFLEV